MGPWRWRLWRLAWAYDARVTAPGWRRLFGRLYWRGGRERVSGLLPAHGMACAWCGEVRHTALEEVWSEAIPGGRLVRLCEECGADCGGG